MKKLIVLSLFLLLVSTFSWGISYQLTPGSCEVSVLTCSPGNEIYSLFGHSAIRVKDSIADLDVVFNYGMFDASSKNFIYHFTLGETDYQLGAQDFNSFVREYRFEHRGIFEQRLALSFEQKQRVFDALLLNYQPEHRTYRYNFFYDNCASRIRDIIRNTLGDQVQIHAVNPSGYTHFSMLAPYLKEHPWTDLGIRIILGAPIYDQVNENDMCFLPDYLEATLNQSKLVQGGQVIPLCKSKDELLPVAKLEISKVWESPRTIALVILICLLLVLWVEFKRKKPFRILNIVLFSSTGLVGVFLTWFMFASVHPAVFPNYDVLWLSPLSLVFGFSLCFKWGQKREVYFHVFMTLCSILFLFLCVKEFGLTETLCSCIVFVRCWGYLLLFRVTQPSPNLGQ